MYASDEPMSQERIRDYVNKGVRVRVTIKQAHETIEDAICKALEKKMNRERTK